MVKKTFLVHLLLALQIAASSGTGLAGAWSQKKGGVYLRVASLYLQTSSEFDYKGRRVENFGYTFEKSPNSIRDPKFRDLSLALYVEYGLSNRLTAIADFSFKSITSQRIELYGPAQDGGETFFETTTSGFADLRAAARFQFLRNPLVAAIQLGGKFPVGYKKPPETGELIMFDEGEEQNRAPLGTGRRDFEAQLLLGRSLYPLPIYITGGAGYRHRGGRTFHDELIYQFEIGLTVNQVLFKLFIDGVHNTSRPLPDKNAIPISTPLAGGVWVNFNVGDQDFLKISPSIIYPIGAGFDFQAEVIHFLSGKNIIDGDILSIGIIYRR